MSKVSDYGIAMMLGAYLLTGMHLETLLQVLNDSSVTLESIALRARVLDKMLSILEEKENDHAQVGQVEGR